MEKGEEMPDWHRFSLVTSLSLLPFPFSLLSAV